MIIYKRHIQKQKFSIYLKHRMYFLLLHRLF